MLQLTSVWIAFNSPSKLYTQHPIVTRKLLFFLFVSVNILKIKKNPDVCMYVFTAFAMTLKMRLSCMSFPKIILEMFLQLNLNINPLRNILRKTYVYCGAPVLMSPMVTLTSSSSSSLSLSLSTSSPAASPWDWKPRNKVTHVKPWMLKWSQKENKEYQESGQQNIREGCARMWRGYVPQRPLRSP